MALAEQMGVTEDGHAVEQVCLESPVLRLRLLALGAAIRSLEAPDRSGELADVHLSLPDLAAYEDHGRNPHLGASIGRYARRRGRDSTTATRSPEKRGPSAWPRCWTHPPAAAGCT